MPLREISNNNQSLSWAARASTTVKKNSVGLRHKSAHANSFNQRAPTRTLPPKQAGNEQPFVVHFDSVAEKSGNSTNESKTTDIVFLDSVNYWSTFFSEETNFWSTSPRFKQDGKCICCLLCGKSIRSTMENESLVQKHVQGSHHKKTFQMMDNLKKLKQADPHRFDDLIKIINQPDNLAPPNSTQKQLLAYYHNVALQALQSKKPLAGIVTHFRRRFLLDKLKDTKATQAPVISNTVDSFGGTEEKDQVTHCNDENPAKYDECSPNPHIGNEENAVGLVVRSPITRGKDTAKHLTDTPFMEPSKPKEARDAESSSTLVDKKLASAESNVLSSIDNTNPAGVCESPSSDISTQSEIGWMGTISELDGILAESHDMFNGSLDDELQKMIETDAEDSSIMGMPMMVVMPIDGMLEEDGHFILKSNVESASGAFAITCERSVEPTEKARDAGTTEQLAVCQSHGGNDSTFYSEKKKHRDICEGSSPHSFVQSPGATERSLEIKRTLECVAALAFMET